MSVQSYLNPIYSQPKTLIPNVQFSFGGEPAAAGAASTGAKVLKDWAIGESISYCVYGGCQEQYNNGVTAVNGAYDYTRDYFWNMHKSFYPH